MSGKNIQLTCGKVKKRVITQTYVLPESPPSISINAEDSYNTTVRISTEGVDYSRVSANGEYAKTWYGSPKRFKAKGIRMRERLSNAFSGFFIGLLGGNKIGGRNAERTREYNEALKRHESNVDHYNLLLREYCATEIVEEEIVYARSLHPSQLEKDLI